VHRAAQLDPWLREHPPELEWKLNWPASVCDPSHEIIGATAAAVERATAGTRRAGPAKVRGFAAVEDTSWLNKAGIPAISCGPGDLRVAHADDEHVLVDELMAACKTYAAVAMDWCGWQSA
jgi:acetylornithine deacetylase